MSKYSIHFTKQDAIKAYDKIEKLAVTIEMDDLNWPKIKRQNGDNIHYLITLMTDKAHALAIVEDDERTRPETPAERPDAYRHEQSETYGTDEYWEKLREIEGRK